jgi:hypothetical protein
MAPFQFHFNKNEVFPKHSLHPKQKQNKKLQFPSPKTKTKSFNFLHQNKNFLQEK